ncbi:hypothetical protein L202_02566 [Cryptococcus amylolentus CBS 6039]|uniref:Uncharacterized protein n=2 Tax=Cryptococcus amylolentus TaxID=104669 RepID=A0A1E3I302_9TREE|nr:hypothetical protein L202_02566 [Cryptococcus amylolentus CBS 6039]ODN82286.1 hypothetical protein L202_02566 [Cryptococcus amylolentus CBS 6039]ODO09642.1 hypothetical protein I350_01854 [Cryptococcus amylolentus CBS 6273]
MGPGPIILGGIAIVGTGYAFKKFVYDPHLAPLIEAAIEEARHRSRNHHFPWETRPQPHAQHTEHESEAIAVPVSASTTALSPAYTTLRRRSVQKNIDGFEMDSRPLSRSISGPGLEKQGPSDRRGWDGAEHDLFLDPPSNDTARIYQEKYHQSSSSASTPLGGAGFGAPEKPLPGRPESAQDAEIRSLLFDAPHTPSHPDPSPFQGQEGVPFMAICPPHPSSFLPHHPNPNPNPSSPSYSSAGAGVLSDEGTAPSTTFSFLSLSPSQLPSPQTPARAIHDLSSASTPTPVSLLSPSTSSPPPSTSTLANDLAPTDLGLTFIHPHVQAPSSTFSSASDSALGSLRRGPMSVVSMSEESEGGEVGEGGRGDSEWEEEDGWSDAGRV